MEVIDGEYEVLEMLQNNKNGLTFDELKEHKKFQADYRPDTMFSVGIDLGGLLRKMEFRKKIYNEKGKYYLAK